MQIKINEKMFSVHPYLSTSWSMIAALHLKGSVLVATLTDGDTINIPNLPQETIKVIFSHHAAYLEKELPEFHYPVEADEMMRQMMNPEIPSSLSFSINSLGMGSPMQHNPEQANAPDLPAEVLEKISAVARIFSPGETNLLPPPEHACNCFHCQILKTLHPATPVSELQDPEEHHEIIQDEDLQFQQWAILQVAEQFFSVTNKLDDSEKYNVFLGSPVGCTCGNDNCEHILAVLKS